MQDDQVNKVKLLSVFEKTLIFKQISHRERIFFFLFSPAETLENRRAATSARITKLDGSTTVRSVVFLVG